LAEFVKNFLPSLSAELAEAEQQEIAVERRREAVNFIGFQLSLIPELTELSPRFIYPGKLLIMWWLDLATLLGRLLTSIFVISLPRLSRNQ